MEWGSERSEGGPRLEGHADAVLREAEGHQLGHVRLVHREARAPPAATAGGGGLGRRLLLPLGRQFRPRVCRLRATCDRGQINERAPA
jgi:hypothetical protein